MGKNSSGCTHPPSLPLSISLSLSLSLSYTKTHVTHFITALPLPLALYKLQFQVPRAPGRVGALGFRIPFYFGDLNVLCCPRPPQAPETLMKHVRCSKIILLESMFRICIRGSGPRRLKWTIFCLFVLILL